MGNIHSIDPTHVRIYQNILHIKSVGKRQEMLEMLMNGPEYVQSAKKAGIYADLLNYLRILRTGSIPGPLPGEQSQPQPQQQQPPSAAAVQNKLIMREQAPPKDPMKVVAKQKNSQKALSFFTTCLRVLDLQEEVALTEEALKKAYKKKAISAHPDKGGSEEQFESITRAYAYLSEIIKLVKGNRTRETEQAALPSIDAVRTNRNEAARDFQHVEPVKLNPKNLNMEAFNRMFEQTRIPDPDDDGYGDWLKGADDSSQAQQQKFSGKFNRNVFNQMFEDEARRSSASTTNALMVRNPEALALNIDNGVLLGREKPQTYTAPANSQMQYTDLRQAYTYGSTFSGEVTGISVAPRSLESYKAGREKVQQFTDEERNEMEQYERQMADAERQRQLRAAHEQVVADQYFERMKQLVIRDS